MSWHGWYDAEPLSVRLGEGGLVEVFIGDQLLQSRHLQPVYDSSHPGPDTLLLLPGAEIAPPNARYSWVNERGRGIILITDGATIVCPLRRKARGANANEVQRHPLAGFWLSIAASCHAEVTIETLASLSGYSYPTCHAWVRDCLQRGTLRESGHAGRQRIHELTQQALSLWWRDIESCWGDWRTPSWPKRHGRGRSVFARFSERLPSLCVGKARATERGWPSQSVSAGWLWATGADHLAARGNLIQNHDTDVWCSTSAWKPLETTSTPLKEPPEGGTWNGVRVTLVEAAHPLMRLLWFTAGAIHPACESSRELLLNRERKPGLLVGLPLLDAQGSGDARVAGRAQEALTTFTDTLQDKR